MVDLVAKVEPCLQNTPLLDIQVLTLYQPYHIHKKIAREAAMPEPDLRRIVLLCNMCDMITLGQHQLYLERMRAHDIAMYGASAPRISSRDEKERLKASYGFAAASKQSDKSLPPRIESIPISF